MNVHVNYNVVNAKVNVGVNVNADGVDVRGFNVNVKAQPTRTPSGAPGTKGGT